MYWESEGSIRPWLGVVGGAMRPWMVLSQESKEINIVLVEEYLISYFIVYFSYILVGAG